MASLAASICCHLSAAPLDFMTSFHQGANFAPLRRMCKSDVRVQRRLFWQSSLRRTIQRKAQASTDRVRYKYEPRRCRNCPDIWAAFPGEDGRTNMLCTRCSKLAGTHEMLRPCRDCNRKWATYADESGSRNKLCGSCAKAAGIHAPQRPCRHCEKKGLQKEANYPDEEGNKYCLCAVCARSAGSYQLRRPCRDCQKQNIQRGAAYPDEEGRSQILCGECAKSAGTNTDRIRVKAVSVEMRNAIELAVSVAVQSD